MNAFQGMPRLQGGMYGDVPYYTYYNPTTNQQKDLPFSTWWGPYSKAMYIIARTISVDDTTTYNALKLFFQTLFRLVPDEASRQCLADFSVMKPYIVTLLMTTAPDVFRFTPGLEDMLRKQPQQFFETCMQNADGQSLLLYVYLINVMFHGMLKKQGAEYLCPCPTLVSIRATFHPESITKYEWGNAIWYILHTSSLHAPEPIMESFANFRAMIHALKYLLPCPKCRVHLMQNLGKINMETCPINRESLFKCTWQLHNIVNASEQKAQISLQQAYAMYN